MVEIVYKRKVYEMQKQRWRLGLRTQSTDGSPEWLGISSLIAKAEEDAFYTIYKKETSPLATAVETHLLPCWEKTCP